MTSRQFEQVKVGERALVNEAITLLTSRLPLGWQLTPSSSAPREADAAVELEAPDGVTTLLVIEVKLMLTPRQVPLIAERFRRFAGWSNVIRTLPVAIYA